MSSSFLVLALTLRLGVPQQAMPAGYNQADAVLLASRIQAYYDQTRDFKAKFKQVYSKRYHGPEAPRFGYLWVKKPGLMRWDYASPRKKQLVCDGAKIWIYDSGDKQVFWSELKESAVPSAVSFLWGSGKITQEFWVKLLGSSKYARPGAKVLRLLPKQPLGSYKHVLFVVDQKTAVVLETVVYDHLGNKNHYVFTSPEANTSPGNDLFRFTPPRGVRVIKGTDQAQP